MATAIFGISNNGLNLVVSLIVLMLVVVWLALIVYTYLDARRRISDPFLVGCATIASFIPYLGTAIYAIVRPPEFLDDARERELEIRAAELRLRQLRDHICPGCSYPVEKNYLRCPRCQRRLKDPCHACGKPVDPRWALCPYCEVALPEGQRQRRQRPVEDRRSGGERKSKERETSKRPPASKAPPQAGGREQRPRRASEELSVAEEPTRVAPEEPSRGSSDEP
jgi:hypothetical protein